MAILAILGNPEALPKFDAIQVWARTLGLDVVGLEIREQKKSLRIRSIIGRARPCTGLSMRWNAYGNCSPFESEVGAVCGKAARTVLGGGVR